MNFFFLQIPVKEVIELGEKEWRTMGNMAPPDEPLCGFREEKCQKTSNFVPSRIQFQCETKIEGGKMFAIPTVGLIKLRND